MATTNKYNKILFSAEEFDFIKANFKVMTNAQIAKVLGQKITTVRTTAYSLGLKRMELEYWTPEMVQYLKDNYQLIGDVELAEFYENEWPKNKTWTKKHLEKKRRYLLLKRTPTELEAIRNRNTSQGRFAVAMQKRWATQGSNAIGTILVWNCNGRKTAQIKTPNGYVHYNRYLWQQHHGTIPAGYNIVKKEGCPEVATIEFLEMISKSEHAQRNVARHHNLPNDLKQIIKLNNKLTKKIKRNEPTN